MIDGYYKEQSPWEVMGPARERKDSVPKKLPEGWAGQGSSDCTALRMPKDFLKRTDARAHPRQIESNAVDTDAWVPVHF